MKTCWGRSTGCFIYSFAIQVGEETLCSKGFTSNLRDILHENNRTVIPTYLVTKSLLYSFCPFLQTENKKVGGLSTRNMSAFCLYQDALYSKAIPNSIEFYKGIFLRYSCSYYSFMRKANVSKFCVCEVLCGEFTAL